MIALNKNINATAAEADSAIFSMAREPCSFGPLALISNTPPAASLFVFGARYPNLL